MAAAFYPASSLEHYFAVHPNIESHSHQELTLLKLKEMVAKHETKCRAFGELFHSFKLDFDVMATMVPHSYYRNDRLVAGSAALWKLMKLLDMPVKWTPNDLDLWELGKPQAKATHESVQIMECPYTSIPELLLLFDVPCCRVAITPTKLVVSHQALRAILTNINYMPLFLINKMKEGVVDDDHFLIKKTCARIDKYRQRGFEFRGVPCGSPLPVMRKEFGYIEELEQADSTEFEYESEDDIKAKYGIDYQTQRIITPVAIRKGGQTISSETIKKMTGGDDKIYVRALSSDQSPVVGPAGCMGPAGCVGPAGCAGDFPTYQPPAVLAPAPMPIPSIPAPVPQVPSGSAPAPVPIPPPQTQLNEGIINNQQALVTAMSTLIDMVNNLAARLNK